jgi:hypothetical protein
VSARAAAGASIDASAPTGKAQSSFFLITCPSLPAEAARRRRSIYETFAR